MSLGKISKADDDIEADLINSIIQYERNLEAKRQPEPGDPVAMSTFEPAFLWPNTNADDPVAKLAPTQTPGEDRPEALPPKQVDEPLPERKMESFTIHASKDGEWVETQGTSPTLIVAKANSLHKTGWDVHITDSDGHRYGPTRFNEALSFDRKSTTKY